MRLALVDTIATIFFFTVVATFSELALAGMEVRQVLVTRALMVPIMVLTGRPYGIWRDWLFIRVGPSRRLARIALDIVAFLSFQVPVYIVTLVVAGADRAEIVTSVGSATLFMIVLSRPFGLFLEFVRQVAGAPDGRPPRRTVPIKPAQGADADPRGAIAGSNQTQGREPFPNRSRPAQRWTDKG